MNAQPLFPMEQQPVHFLAIEGHDPSGEVYMVFKCDAPEGARCRLKPADDREEWSFGDPDLVDSGKCWASEWVEATSIEEALIADCAGTEEFGRVPVRIAYDEGVKVSQFEPDEPIVRTIDTALGGGE